MPIRLRKLLGSIVLVVYSILYFWVAVTVAIMRLPELATAWHLLFYFLATVVWMIPAAAIIYWIQVPRPGDPAPYRPQ